MVCCVSPPQSCSVTLTLLDGKFNGLDDFGVGFSSLGLLHQHPFKTLKLDQYFFTPSAASPRNNEVIHAIINLALNLKLRIVAEGVQSSEQAWLLANLRCHSAQGFYFYEPMAPPQFSGFITRLNAERNPPLLNTNKHTKHHIKRHSTQLSKTHLN